MTTRGNTSLMSTSQQEDYSVPGTTDEESGSEDSVFFDNNQKLLVRFSYFASIWFHLISKYMFECLLFPMISIIIYFLKTAEPSLELKSFQHKIPTAVGIRPILSGLNSLFKCIYPKSKMVR